MSLRPAMFLFLTLISVQYGVAQEPLAEARTLDEVIAKYRAEQVLASGDEGQSSPLFMTLGERRLAFAHFDAFIRRLNPAMDRPELLRI